MIILDTNVVSELIRREPSSTVLEKVKSFPSSDIYTTAITEAEIRLGLAILAPGRKRTALRMQVDLILKEDFAGRILAFDSEAAQAYAAVFDAQIAAIAQTHEGVLLTRNTRDFHGCGVGVIDPWSEGGR